MSNGTVFKLKRRNGASTINDSAIENYDIGATFDNVVYYNADNPNDKYNGITLTDFFNQMQNLVTNGQFIVRGTDSPSTTDDTQLAFWIDDTTTN